jgi:hypothetical protein
MSTTPGPRTEGKPLASGTRPLLLAGLALTGSALISRRSRKGKPFA